MKYQTLNTHNITLFDFNDIFELASIKIINELQEYDLIDSQINLKNRDVKKIFIFYIIYELCETIRSIKNNTGYKKVIAVQPSIDLKFEICSLCNINELNLFVQKIIKQLQKLLPIIFIEIEEEIDFHSLQSYMLTTGEGKEILFNIILLCQEEEKNIKSFENVKKFAKKYELTFLSDTYFNSLHAKQLFFINR